MDAFSEMGPSVTDTLVTALTNVSASQEAMDNRLNEMSKKFEERNTTLTNQFNNFQKNQTQQPQRGSSSQNRGQNSISSIAEILEAASAVIIEDSEDLNQIIRDLNGRIRTKLHIHHDNSYINIFRSKTQITFFSRSLPVSNLRIQTFKIKILKIKTHSLRIQIFNRNSRLKSLLQILITCLIHNKLRPPVINVAILIT